MRVDAADVRQLVHVDNTPCQPRGKLGIAVQGQRRRFREETGEISIQDEILNKKSTFD
jgi:predicted ester cyclase